MGTHFGVYRTIRSRVMIRREADVEEGLRESESEGVISISTLIMINDCSVDANVR